VQAIAEPVQQKVNQMKTKKSRRRGEEYKKEWKNRKNKK
jgi:hypothetical protein